MNDNWILVEGEGGVVLCIRGRSIGNEIIRTCMSLSQEERDSTYLRGVCEVYIGRDKLS